MSEEVYTQVEDAIRDGLHVCYPIPDRAFGPKFFYPVAIEHGDIVLRDSDCGLAKDTIRWSPGEWREHVSADGGGLFRKVGMWDFVPHSDPAADMIRFAHRSPAAVGRMLYDAQEREARLRRMLHAVSCWAERGAPLPSVLVEDCRREGVDDDR